MGTETRVTGVMVVAIGLGGKGVQSNKNGRLDDWRLDECDIKDGSTEMTEVNGDFIFILLVLCVEHELDYSLCF